MVAVPLELVQAAHHDIVTGRARERNVRDNASIAIFPRERYVTPDFVTEIRVKCPSIVESRAVDVFDANVAQL